MSNPFVAEIRMFCGNFAPTQWAECDGQLLPISQNTALFSLLGTFYGGDGKSTFALPDLQGSVPMGEGQGVGLSQRFLGEVAGQETVTLLQSEIPVHTHNLVAHAAHAGANPTVDVGQGLAKSSGGAAYTDQTNASTQLHFLSTGIAGGSLPHENMSPYLCVTFIIALQGVFPPRS